MWIYRQKQQCSESVVCKPCFTGFLCQRTIHLVGWHLSYQLPSAIFTLWPVTACGIPWLQVVTLCYRPLIILERCYMFHVALSSRQYFLQFHIYRVLTTAPLPYFYYASSHQGLSPARTVPSMAWKSFFFSIFVEATRILLPIVYVSEKPTSYGVYQSLPSVGTMLGKN